MRSILGVPPRAATHMREHLLKQEIALEQDRVIRKFLSNVENPYYKDSFFVSKIYKEKKIRSGTQSYL